MTYPNVVEPAKAGKQYTKEQIYEFNLYKKLSEFLRKRNFVSLVEGGVRELIK